MASKILAIAYPFAKFAQVFSCQNFPLYGNLCVSDYLLISANTVEYSLKFWIAFNTGRTIIPDILVAKGIIIITSCTLANPVLLVQKNNCTSKCHKRAKNGLVSLDCVARLLWNNSVDYSTSIFVWCSRPCHGEINGVDYSTY